MNMQTFVGVVLAVLAGYVLAGFVGSETAPEATARISVPETAIELTKCMPSMGYHYADPETLPRGPIYLRDGDGEVVGIEYLFLEEELERGEGPGREFMLSAFKAGFENVSLAFEPEGVGELPMPLYALHLYKLDDGERAGICEGEELESDHHDNESTAGLMVGDNAVAAFAQPSAEAVTVSLAVLAKDGYVVIHEVQDGDPGTIIATSEFLSAGEHNNEAVTLSEAPTPGTELIAMLHADNGDGQFDAADDAPVMHDGSPIMARFVIDNAADVPAGVSI